MKKIIATALFLLLIPYAAWAAQHDGKTSMDKNLLRECIVSGTVFAGCRVTEDVIQLLMETAAAESRCGKYDIPHKARGSHGAFQITELSAKDTLEWLKRSDWDMWRTLMEDCYDPDDTLVGNLTTNVEFAAAVAWLIYRRMGGKSPDISTREKRAALWKRVYNTPLGSGSEAGYMRAAKECLDEIH